MTSVNSGKVSRRYIPVHVKIKIRPVLHALTGCYTSSSPFDIGKKVCFKAVFICRTCVSLTAKLPRNFHYTCVARELISCMTQNADINQRSEQAQFLDLQLVKPTFIRLLLNELSFKQHVVRFSIQTSI